MHSNEQLKEFINKCFGSTSVTGQGNNCNFNVICPICKLTKDANYSKKKLAIKADNQLTKCWSCGYKSRNLKDIIKRFFPNHLESYIKEILLDTTIQDNNTPTTLEEHTITTNALPDSFQLLAEQWNKEDVPWFISQAKNYLLSRKITFQDCWYYKLGISCSDPNYKNRIIIPSHNIDGTLNFFTSRAIKPHIKPKYFNPNYKREDIIFNELNIDWDKELTIVEGPFDLIKCNENATCLLGKELTIDYKLFKQITESQTPILLALDDDARKQTFRIAELLLSYDIQVRVFLDLKQFHDVGEMSKEEFNTLSKQAKNITKFDILKEKLKEI